MEVRDRDQHLSTEEKSQCVKRSGCSSMCTAIANPHHVLWVWHAVSSTDTLNLQVHTERGVTTLQMKNHFFRKPYNQPQLLGVPSYLLKYTLHTNIWTAAQTCKDA